MEHKRVGLAGFSPRDIRRLTILRRLIAAKRAVEAGYYSDAIDGVQVVPLTELVGQTINGVAWAG